MKPDHYEYPCHLRVLVSLSLNRSTYHKIPWITLGIVYCERPFRGGLWGIIYSGDYTLWLKHWHVHVARFSKSAIWLGKISTKINITNNFMVISRQWHIERMFLNYKCGSLTNCGTNKTVISIIFCCWGEGEGGYTFLYMEIVRMECQGGDYAQGRVGEGLSMFHWKLLKILHTGYFHKLHVQ